MKTNLYNYFYFTRAERNGAWLLCLLCVVFFAFPYVWKEATPQQRTSAFKAQFASFNNSASESASFKDYSNTSTILFAFNPNTIAKDDWVKLGLSSKLAQTIINYRSKGGHFRRKEDLLKIYGMKTADYERLEPYIQLENAMYVEHSSAASYTRKPVQLFAFDPNKAPEEDLVKLGLSAKTAATIVKYRNKGGTFRTKEDLKKIYGLQEKDYERLLPYINIETAPPSNNTQKPVSFTEAPKSPDSKSFTKKPVIIDINQADVETWQTLHGIGAAYARKIVNFREKLGGFSSITQVGETYGLPDSTFQQIKLYLKESAILRTIALNTATLDELKAHPYIDSRKAAAIISYREQHGKFHTLDELRQMKALPAAWLDKLMPYLRLD